MLEAGAFPSNHSSLKSHFCFLNNWGLLFYDRSAHFQFGGLKKWIKRAPLFCTGSSLYEQYVFPRARKRMPVNNTQESVAWSVAGRTMLPGLQGWRPARCTPAAGRSP